jgi:cytochrome P450
MGAADAEQTAIESRMRAILRSLVVDRRSHPGDDVISLLIRHRWSTTTATSRSSTTTSCRSGSSSWLAGHETVAAHRQRSGRTGLHLTSGASADPSLIPNAVEEMLRWDPPSHYQGRWVERDVTLHGVTIPADSRVILITGAANHDERAFPDAEYFDIHREIERHVGFGFGIHLCIGAALARLETRIAFEELLARYPNYEVRQPMVRAYSSNVRGLSNLPLALEPAA